MRGAEIGRSARTAAPPRGDCEDMCAETPYTHDEESAMWMRSGGIGKSRFPVRLPCQRSAHQLMPPDSVPIGTLIVLETTTPLLHGVLSRVLQKLLPRKLALTSLRNATPGLELVFSVLLTQAVRPEGRLLGGWVTGVYSEFSVTSRDFLKQNILSCQVDVFFPFSLGDVCATHVSHPNYFTKSFSEITGKVHCVILVIREGRFWMRLPDVYRCVHSLLST